MPKPQDIFQLAQQEAVRVTASPQAWQSFLYTAAHNYHTTYLNQLLIHAQRPDAAACASIRPHRAAVIPESQNSNLRLRKGRPAGQLL